MQDDTPCIAEQYACAATSSNLRVQAEKRSSADILIASGMVGQTLGGALMRLRTEYGSNGVPRRHATQTDHRLMMGKLKTLPAVLQAVTAQAHYWGIDRPEAVAMAVVSHWLDNVCRHCEGRGKERIQDTPTLSVKNCKPCHGTGHTDLTHGSAGRRMAGFMEDCINRWRQSTAKRLHGMR